eukprot:4359573-Amphidinium_carterae.1
MQCTLRLLGEFTRPSVLLATFHLAHGIAPLTICEIVSVAIIYAKNRGLNVTLTRESIPKCGPKPPGDRNPKNAVEPMFIDSTQRDAAVPLLD